MVGDSGDTRRNRPWSRAFWWEPASLRVHEECVAIPWGPSSLRVAILSDLHIGSPFVDISRLKQIVDQTNVTRPDVVFILGDLVIQGVLGGSFVPPEDMTAELKRLQAASGVFAVLGNHDVWFDAARVRKSLEKAGVQVLEDRALSMPTASGPIWLAGVTDYWTQRHDVRAALAAVHGDAPLLVITHNPDIFPDIPDRVSLTIAGHTHGGQVRLPILGRPIVPSRFGQKYAAGHIVESTRHLYVATGIGTSILPVRFLVPPSITVLTIGASCSDASV